MWHPHCSNNIGQRDVDFVASTHLSVLPKLISAIRFPVDVEGNWTGVAATWEKTLVVQLNRFLDQQGGRLKRKASVVTLVIDELVQVFGSINGPQIPFEFWSIQVCR